MLQNKLQVFVASFTAALVTVVLTYGTTFPRMYFKRNIHSRLLISTPARQICETVYRECIRRYFFSSSSQRSKEAKIKNITPDLRLVHMKRFAFTSL